MSDYNVGKAAAEAALKIIGKGKVVGLVGFATAQHAINHMAGIQDTLKVPKSSTWRSSLIMLIRRRR